MKTRQWTATKLLKLYKIRKAGTKWSEIGRKFKKSARACRMAYERINWDNFLKDPEGYFQSNPSKKWTDDEMVRLDAYLQSDKSYRFIADRLGRTITSVERQSQETDWGSWRAIKESNAKDQECLGEESKKETFLEDLIEAMIRNCRYSFERLKVMKEKDFLRRTSLEKDRLFLTFDELKKKTVERLEKLGFGNPESVDMEEGTYVIVGDSHGKHTKKNVFALLRQVNKHLKPKKIIHIGHILDDDNDISYEWGGFDNLMVLSKIEELQVVQDQRRKFNFNYEIVRDTINVGGLAIASQDIIADYVKTPIKTLQAEMFEEDEMIVVNCHRLEFFSRTFNNAPSYIASPGSLCERHIIKTIKQIDFTDGRIVKQAFWDGFSKYRRMRHMNKYWEQGLLIIQVNKEGHHTVVPCPIKKCNNGMAISYFDKMITSKGVFAPDKKIFINGDMHCDEHDVNILSIQEEVCKDYKPDVCVNVGDTMNYSSLNHHIMDRGGVIINKKILDEAAETHSILKRVAKWAKKNHLIYGNHERFATDFLEKYPQFENYLDFKFLCDVEDIGYILTELKDVLKIGTAKFVHGEVRMYGQTGSKMEKAARTFGRDVFIGHIHCPAIRFGCYSIGLTGKLDQGYNEPSASQWIHGFGLCNQYKGKSWATTIAIIDNKCVLNKKTYSPKNVDSWKLKGYSAKLVYDINDNDDDKK